MHIIYTIKTNTPVAMHIIYTIKTNIVIAVHIIYTINTNAVEPCTLSILSTQTQ